jgi:copper homeostasis protein
MKEANRHNTRITFHRAFDALDSPLKAVQTLIDFGCHRVLTSGTPWDSTLGAAQGISNLKNIIHAAERRIEVVIGGGISAETASHLFEKLPKDGVSVHAYSSVRSGGVTDALKVRQLVDAVNGLGGAFSG